MQKTKKKFPVFKNIFTYISIVFNYRTPFNISMVYGKVIFLKIIQLADWPHSL